MVTEQQAVITEKDWGRLQEMIASIRQTLPTSFETYLRDLEGQLADTAIVPPASVEGGTVTMNSKVLLRDVNSGTNQAVTLVYDGNADPYGEKISVLSTLGASLLGSRVGDVLEWNTRRGPRRMRIAEILYQPEAAGNFDL